MKAEFVHPSLPHELVRRLLLLNQICDVPVKLSLSVFVLDPFNAFLSRFLEGRVLEKDKGLASLAIQDGSYLSISRRILNQEESKDVLEELYVFLSQ